MKQRPAARILVLDRTGRILLFRFEHSNGPLAGKSFWATPGGAVDEGESFEQAAARELLEETGISNVGLGPQVGQRTAVFTMPDGDVVEADERYFLVKIAKDEISREGWTDLEQDVMVEHRWWTLEDLSSTDE